MNSTRTFLEEYLRTFIHLLRKLCTYYMFGNAIFLSVKIFYTKMSFLLRQHILGQTLMSVYICTFKKLMPPCVIFCNFDANNRTTTRMLFILLTSGVALLQSY